MQDKYSNDSLLGIGDQFLGNSDALLNGEREAENEKSADEAAIDKCIAVFLKMNPFEFNDEDFLVATMTLDGRDFARAVYRVYLRRECEHEKLHLGYGFQGRMENVQQFRRSPEFKRRWATEILAEQKKHPIKAFFNRLWIEMTG
jgi:hypothetical protein